MTFTRPVLSGAVPVVTMLVPQLPCVPSYLSHCAICPRTPHLLTRIRATLSTCSFWRGMVTPPTLTGHLYALICLPHFCFIFPMILKVPFKSVLPNWKTTLKGGTPATAEYTAEETTILPKIVPLTVLAGSMVLDGMPPLRHDFTVSHRNATPRMRTAKL